MRAGPRVSARRHPQPGTGAAGYQFPGLSAALGVARPDALQRNAEAYSAKRSLLGAPAIRVPIGFRHARVSPRGQARWVPSVATTASWGSQRATGTGTAGDSATPRSSLRSPRFWGAENDAERGPVVVPATVVRGARQASVTPQHLFARPQTRPLCPGISQIAPGLRDAWPLAPPRPDPRDPGTR